MSLPLEAPRTVQVTQTGLTTGVGMNEPSKALGTKRGLAVVCTEATNQSWLLLQLGVSTRTCQRPYFDKCCNLTSNIHNIYHMSNFPNNNQHSPNYSLSPSNIICSYHIKMRYQCMINKWATNWNYCIYWIHKNQVVPTHNIAPLTRNEKYSIQTYNGNSLQLIRCWVKRPRSNGTSFHSTIIRCWIKRPRSNGTSFHSTIIYQKMLDQTSKV